MKKPLVAVVGRPNVGKSTFFNKMVGRKISIVEDRPGVTRDRIYADCKWQNYVFTMIDTGGIELDSDEIILSQMRNQAMLAIDVADVILFMVDGRNDITNTDFEVANILRKTKKKVILVVNKIDDIKFMNNIYNFYELNLGEPIGISASNGLNLGDLLDKIVEDFDKQNIDNEDEDIIKVAVVGKPNAGKSSLINKILGEERVIVSEIAGTTRDAIDTEFENDGKKYIFIDTAGLRKKGKINDDIEKYSSYRTLNAIDRADVVLIMIDAVEGVTEQDTKIAGYAHDNGKASIILINKWDLIKKDNSSYKKFENEVKRMLSFMPYAMIEMISVVDNTRLDNILSMVDYAYNQSCMRVPTGMLNDVIADAILMHQLPSDKGKQLKIYYATQVSTKPPKILLFINDRELAHFSYIRYIENQIRANFNFDATPIIIELKEKNNKNFNL